MTIVINLEPEKEARIHALMGSMAYLGPSHIAEDHAEEIAREEAELSEKIKAARGIYSHISGGSDEFRRNR